MIITIDGPSCTGKSSAAFLVAQNLHLLYINSGLLFRGIAYVFNEHSHSAHKDAQDFFDTLDKQLKDLHYSYTTKQGAKLLLKHTDITHLLKSPEITQLSSQLSSHALIRNLVLAWQQRLAVNNNAIIEGRDTGSVVFPHADIKIFLTASSEVRAERWQNFQETQGILLTAQEAYHQVIERDDRDSSRAHSPLKVPEGAIIIDNSTLSLDQTAQIILDHIQELYPTA